MYDLFFFGILGVCSSHNGFLKASNRWHKACRREESRSNHYRFLKELGGIIPPPLPSLFRGIEKILLLASFIFSFPSLLHIRVVRTV